MGKNTVKVKAKVQTKIKKRPHKMSGGDSGLLSVKIVAHVNDKKK